MLSSHLPQFLEDGQLFDFECRLMGCWAEERKRESVRYRTKASTLSGDHALDLTPPTVRLNEELTDRRIQRTRALLHEALGSLIREKTYDRITVAQILGRAKVSRSTFYIHFRGKDDLLASAMRALLVTILSDGGDADIEPAERMVAFSLPLLAHVQQHRRSAKVRLGERGRAILHQHLRRVISEWIVQSLDGENLQHRKQRRSPIEPELLARHIASTFVLVLHWWLDRGDTAPAAEADRVFRALVMPLLQSGSAKGADS
jgi:AcrR family transcriptional regulator